MLSKNILHHNILKLTINPCIQFYVYMNVFKFIIRDKRYFIKMKKKFIVYKI